MVTQKQSDTYNGVLKETCLQVRALTAHAASGRKTRQMTTHLISTVCSNYRITKMRLRALLGQMVGTSQASFLRLAVVTRLSISMRQRTRRCYKLKTTQRLETLSSTLQPSYLGTPKMSNLLSGIQQTIYFSQQAMTTRSGFGNMTKQWMTGCVVKTFKAISRLFGSLTSAQMGKTLLHALKTSQLSSGTCKGNKSKKQRIAMIDQFIPSVGMETILPQLVQTIRFVFTKSMKT